MNAYYFYLKMYRYVIQLFLSIIAIGCHWHSEKEINPVANVFSDFKVLKKDSITCFNILDDHNIAKYQFYDYTFDKPFITNIQVPSGRISKNGNIIYLCPKITGYKKVEFELFDFNLNKGESKTCWLKINNDSFEYQLNLKDKFITSIDSVYWFRNIGLKLISCEISNFMVSSKSGIISFFESYKSDTSKVYCLNLVGEIPDCFKSQIHVLN